MRVYRERYLMKAFDLLITVASWEERFRLGTERIQRSNTIPQLLMYYYEEYSERTYNNRMAMRSLGWSSSSEHGLKFSHPKDAWKKLEEDIASLSASTRRVLLDISTMPREMIWYFLFLLERKGHTISYIYNKPARYNEGWLSRDPGRPRLVYNQGGIAKLGCSTVLLITSGFDSDRIGQFVAFFEPKVVLIATQKGDQFENVERNLNAQQTVNLPKEMIERVTIDAYSEDHGMSVLAPYVARYVEENNVVMSSLGPKPSAIALYKIRKQYPEAALAYSPSKEFNPDYSTGIGESIVGEL